MSVYSFTVKKGPFQISLSTSDMDFVDEQFDYAETVIHYETKVRDIAYLGGVLSAPEGYSLSYIEELNNNR